MPPPLSGEARSVWRILAPLKGELSLKATEGLIDTKIENRYAAMHTIKWFVDFAFCMIDIRDDYVTMICHPNIAAWDARIIANICEDIWQKGAVKATA